MEMTTLARFARLALALAFAALVGGGLSAAARAEEEGGYRNNHHGRYEEHREHGERARREEWRDHREYGYTAPAPYAGYAPPPVVYAYSEESEASSPLVPHGVRQGALLSSTGPRRALSE